MLQQECMTEETLLASEDTTNSTPHGLTGRAIFYDLDSPWAI